MMPENRRERSRSRTRKSSITNGAGNMYDKFIHKLRQFRPANNIEPHQYRNVLNEKEIGFIVDEVKQEFADLPALLELDPPLMVCGDTHGQYADVRRLLEYCDLPPKRRYLFLGDYVDRGPYSIETVTLMFLYSLRYPEDFFILRGNHETALVNRTYGFYNECLKRYGKQDGIIMWSNFQLAFDCLPLSATIGGRILCMHGGLSPQLNSIAQIRHMSVPMMIPNMNCLANDLLWADPEKGVRGWRASNRGISYLFGEDVVNKFCERQNIDIICRAHQVVQNGFEFFAGKRLVTIFSAPNYCNEFSNLAGMFYVDANLDCTIRAMKGRKPSGSLRTR